MAAQLHEVSQGVGITVRIVSAKDVADGVRSFELSRAVAGALPCFQPGAHIDVYLDSGKVRQYSLCGSLADRSTYRIAVQRDLAGRGGSSEIFDTWRPGKTILISEPRNQFELREGAARYLLIAGGIGITPLLPMAWTLESAGADFCLYYCTRDRGRTAFLDELEPLVETGRVVVHHDDGLPERQLDFASLLKEPRQGAHLYFCGPRPMMKALEQATAHWPRECVHREYFGADDNKPSGNAFLVRLQRSAMTLEVPPHKTIVEVLRDAGVPVDVSCEKGVCGTCRTKYLAGEPVHGDLVLDERERAEYVMICCARASTGELVLDL